MDFTKQSFGRLLGFTEKNYTDSNKYTAETINSFEIKEVYVFIPNIDKSPICKISSKNKVSMLIDKNKVINKLDSVIVRISDTKEDVGIYHEFQGNKPDLEISFVYI